MEYSWSGLKLVATQYPNECPLLGGSVYNSITTYLTFYLGILFTYLLILVKNLVFIY